MLTQKDFGKYYQQSVGLIKQLKINNDTLTKNLGMESPKILQSELKVQQYINRQVQAKIQNYMQKLTQNYLDPETARKIGTLKQQLKVQKERRGQIINKIELAIENQKQNSKYNSGITTTYKYQNMLSFEIQSKSNTNTNSYYTNQNNNDDNKEKTEQTKNSMLQQQQQIQDLEIEHHLLHQRSKQLHEVHNKILEINNIAKDTAQLTYKQGEDLDHITQETMKTKFNVTNANKQLNQANEYQKKSKSKYVWLAGFAIVAIAVILFLIFI